MNRAKGSMRACPEAEAWFGIENGMWEDCNGKWVDGACIYVIVKGEVDPHIIWSDTIEIPLLGTPFYQKKGPNGEWSELKDPHSVITQGKRSRRMFLSDSIDQWYQTHKSNLQF